jgi:hypothetical protein
MVDLRHRFGRQKSVRPEGRTGGEIDARRSGGEARGPTNPSAGFQTRTLLTRNGVLGVSPQILRRVDALERPGHRPVVGFHAPRLTGVAPMMAPLSSDLPEQKAPRHKKKPAARRDFQTRCSDWCARLRSAREVLDGVDDLVTAIFSAVTRWVCHALVLVGSVGASTTSVTGGLNISTAREAAPWAIGAVVGGAGTAVRTALRRRDRHTTPDSSNDSSNEGAE